MFTQKIAWNIDQKQCFCNITHSYIYTERKNHITLNAGYKGIINWITNLITSLVDTGYQTARFCTFHNRVLSPPISLMQEIKQSLLECGKKMVILNVNRKFYSIFDYNFFYINDNIWLNDIYMNDIKLGFSIRLQV